MTAKEIVAVLGRLNSNTQQALAERAQQRDPRFAFICDLVDEVQTRLQPAAQVTLAPLVSQQPLQQPRSPL